MFLYKTTPTEIQNILNKLNKKATGHHLIPIKFWDNFGKYLNHKIYELINNMFTQQEFPNCLKITQIIPIHKADNKQEIGNYRPVSILPFLSKIFETAILKRLPNFLDINQIINKNQFGFTNKSSTLAATMQLMNYIQMEMDKKQQVACLFLDIKKAYDNVQHEILFRKLNNLKQIKLKLFQSFHKNRKTIR